jgi:hypothetical protein
LSKETDRVKWPSTISNNLVGQMRELSRQTKIPLSALIDEAGEDLIAKYKDAKEVILKRVGGV